VLSFPLEAHGYGAILATNGELSNNLRQLADHMKTLTAKPLSAYSSEWKTLPQQLVEISKTKSVGSAPENMVKVPGGDYLFKVAGIEIEGFNDIGVDVQYPWEDMPRRFHDHRMQIKAFYMDKYPVTNAQFKKFLDSTSYQPKDRLNFLRDWKNGSYPAGWANKPVTGA
jgi:formylglycine-generating enzyme required for sulfatase activity